MKFLKSTPNFVFWLFVCLLSTHSLSAQDAISDDEIARYVQVLKQQATHQSAYETSVSQTVQGYPSGAELFTKALTEGEKAIPSDKIEEYYALKQDLIVLRETLEAQRIEAARLQGFSVERYYYIKEQMSKDHVLHNRIHTLLIESN
jgi:hypothetical protein